VAKKTKDEILQQLLKRLQQDTEIVDVDPGSIARAFCEILSEEFYQFYSELDLNTTMTFVSTAQGTFLDLIGSLLNCKRTPSSETDANFRTRITNQVYVIAGGNVTAIRLKILSVEGVKDVILREFTKGTGSFTAYVITDTPETPIFTLNEVRSAIENTKSWGIFAEVKAPVLIPVDLKVRLIISDKVSDAEKSTIRTNAQLAMKTHIDNLGLGGQFIINDIIRQAMNASPKILDADLSNLKVNGASQFSKNFSVNWDERIVIRSFDVV
jgi:uncharacterized phage protein gp47/JayE